MKVQAGSAEEKAFEAIDRQREADLERIKALMRIPSIAAEDMDGVRRCADHVLAWFRELGCRDARIFETKGSPVVYGHYDAGAESTVLVYFMYDVKQVSGETWTMIRDPFDPQVVPMAPFRKVLVGRGAVNSKGPMGAFLNALAAIRASGGEIPVNLTFIAEGEEELGSMHLIDFVQAERSRLKDAVACISPSASQNIQGVPSLSLGCKGVVEVELECSGAYWRRGPTKRGIHSSLLAIVESPMWRMVQALASMVDPKDPSRVLIEGFYDNVAAPTKRDLQIIDELAKLYDEEAVRRANDVEHFVHDLHGKDLLMKALYTTTLNIQGISGGYTGPKFKTVLPHTMKVKLESRLIPNQTRSETLAKIRRHLDGHGYADIKVVDTSSELSDDWSRTDPDAGIVAVVREAYESGGYAPQVWPFMLGTSPQYLWTKVLGIPFVSVGLGHGARAHAPDEYYVIEGDGGKHPVAGLAEAEKFFVHVLYSMAGRQLG